MKRETENERKPKKPRFALRLIMKLHLFTKKQMIPGSTRTFWYKSFAISKGKHKVQKKAHISDLSQNEY